jgi:hypothetical protein
MFRNELIFDNYDYALGGLRAFGITAGVGTRDGYC